MKTRISQLLGTRYPIVQGGMMWVGRAELAAAVSNAGALGMLTALTQPNPDALRSEIARCRTMTTHPFGVNLTIFPSASPPPYMEYARAIVESGVRVVETAGNHPEEITRVFLDHGCTIVHKCTSVRHALSAQKRGVHAVSIDGFECAGHPGEDDVPGLILIRAAARKLEVPIIASGGIADGAGMAAALVLGAEGINMGTRFMLTQEAPIHEDIKKALVDASERDTALIFRKLHNTARVWRNGVAKEVESLEAQPGGALFEDLRPLVAGARGRQGLESGNPQHGLVWAGQCIGLIDDIPKCAELVERMVRECRASLQRAAELTMMEAAVSAIARHALERTGDSESALNASEVDTAITSRFSVRAFLPRPVPRAYVEDVLGVASRAPSGGNTRPWRVYVLEGASRAALVKKICAAHDATMADPALADAHRQAELSPPRWVSPFLERRRENGLSLYRLLGIGKGDKLAMHRQHQANYRFFDAPVGLLFTLHRELGTGSMLDCGMFMQNIMIAARARGLHTCPQGAWNRFASLVLPLIGAGPDEILICGMALGYADPDAVVNRLRTPREEAQDFTCWPHIATA